MRYFLSLGTGFLGCVIALVGCAVPAVVYDLLFRAAAETLRLPHAEEAAKRVLSLPMYAELTPNEVDHIVETVLDCSHAAPLTARSGGAE